MVKESLCPFQKFQKRLQSTDMKFTFTRILVSLSILLSFIGASLTPHTVQAQSSGVIYIVQNNDSLSSISQYFHTSPVRIALANYITDMNFLAPGTHLLIPGFTGLSGTLTPIKIGLGDTPLSLMRQSRSDPVRFHAHQLPHQRGRHSGRSKPVHAHEREYGKHPRSGD